MNVYGSEGTFKHDVQGTGWFDSGVGGACGVPDSREYPGRERRCRVLHGFLDSLGGLGEPLVGAREVFDVMAVCFAADESAERGVPVSVRYEEW